MQNLKFSNVDDVKSEMNFSRGDIFGHKYFFLIRTMAIKRGGEKMRQSFDERGMRKKSHSAETILIKLSF